jgi:hypothetical protein
MENKELIKIIKNIPSIKSICGKKKILGVRAIHPKNKI